MSWYGNYNEPNRQLDALLDTKPSLAALLLCPDFLPQLKTYNPKLLDYLTNSSTLPAEMITYISVPPSQADTPERKYKLPLLTIEMIETETICIMNALLKPYGNSCALLAMGDMLRGKQLLPLLAGYLFRVNLALCRGRLKETLEVVYSCPPYLELLVLNADNENIANCLMLFLCVESSKNIVLGEQKAAIKMSIFRLILGRIEAEKSSQQQRSIRTIENLSAVVREVIDKVYLNMQGKQMLEIALEERYIQCIICMMNDRSENSFPAMQLVLSYLKYYCLSAYNSDQGTDDLNRKNMERLEGQAFVRQLMATLKVSLEIVKKERAISLYGYRLLQVICHSITLSSQKMLACIKEAELFPTLVELLFRNQNCNILHKLVESSFLYVFTTQKTIYEKYKEYLFCEISVIDLTAKRLLDLFPEAEILEKAKLKGYFGVLIRIIKIYSSILTTNERIKQAITAKTELWNKISKKVLKPYEASFKEEMGKFENVPDTVPLEFSVFRIDNGLMPRLVQNAQALEQVKREEETMPKTFESSISESKKQAGALQQPKIIENDVFFQSPLEQGNKIKVEEQMVASSHSTTSAQSENKQNDRKKSFSEFMNKKKVQVGEEIKMNRSISGQKRLSSSDKKTRLTSPSPSKKRNSWKEEEAEAEPKKPHGPVIKDLPKIPVAHKMGSSHSSDHLSKSAVGESKKVEEDQKNRTMTLSSANLQSLKKTTIIRTNQMPKQKKYRKFDEKDEALFAYLGLKV